MKTFFGLRQVSEGHFEFFCLEKSVEGTVKPIQLVGVTGFSKSLIDGG